MARGYAVWRVGARGALVLRVGTRGAMVLTVETTGAMVLTVGTTGALVLRVGTRDTLVLRVGARGAPVIRVRWGRRVGERLVREATPLERWWIVECPNYTTCDDKTSTTHSLVPFFILI